jgi:hypothetical protein
LGEDEIAEAEFFAERCGVFGHGPIIMP